MLHFLKSHPFAVEAFFDYSLVLTFAVPKESLRPFVPRPLEPDLFQDRFGFVAMALVATKGLRPKGFPAWLGNDFFLIGYRIFVRYTTPPGRRLRGLYILKSETNRKKMEWLGNLFTHYNYTTTDINIVQDDRFRQISSKKSNFELQVEMGEENVPLPARSPFSSWKDARRFAGPLPFTFSLLPPSNQVLIIEGVRENWEPQPVRILHHRISFLESLGLPDQQLASAFLVQNIPYSWKKGRIVS